MTAEQEQLKLLEKIAYNTSKIGGASASTMGNFTGDSPNSKFDSATDGLSGSIKDLTKWIIQNKKISKELAKVSDVELKQRNKTVKDAKGALSDIESSTKKQIKEISNAIDHLSDVFGVIDKKAILDEKKAFLAKENKEAIEFWEGVEKEANDTFDKITKQQIENNKSITEKFGDTLKENGKTLGTYFKASLAGFITRMSSIAGAGSGMLGTIQTEGFATGGFSGIFDAMIDSIKLGASPEDTLKFVNSHRIILSKMADNILLSAEAGTAVVADYGEQLRLAFGGGNQLERMGKMFNILTELGIETTSDSFSRLKDTMEELQVSTEMGADELFSTLSGLASDKTFQALYAGSNSEELLYSLKESFNLVREAAILTGDEFFDLNRRIAQQQQTNIADRIVQASVAANLATEFGMSDESVDLLRRGMTSFISLDEDKGEKTGFIAAVAEFQKLMAENVTEAGKNVEKNRLMSLDIQRGMIGDLADPNFAAMLRSQAKLGGPDEAQKLKDRQDATAGDDEFILQLNATLGALISGIAQSPLGVAIAGAGGIIGQVAIGTTMGVIAGMAAPLLGIVGVAGGLVLLAAAAKGLYDAFNLQTVSSSTLGQGLERLGAGLRGMADFMLGLPAFLISSIQKNLGLETPEWVELMKNPAENLGNFLVDSAKIMGEDMAAMAISSGWVNVNESAVANTINKSDTELEKLLKQLELKKEELKTKEGEKSENEKKQLEHFENLIAEIKKQTGIMNEKSYTGLVFGPQQQTDKSFKKRNV